jgi:hypothetical protein
MAPIRPPVRPARIHWHWQLAAAAAAPKFQDYGSEERATRDGNGMTAQAGAVHSLLAYMPTGRR